MAGGMIEYEWMPEPVVIADELALMAARFEQRTAVMHAALEVVTDDVNQQFEEEGPGWAPWTPGYEASGQHGASILDRTGALRQGATSKGSYEVNREFILWTGAEAPAYWRFHAFGTVKMPQRSWIGLTPQGEERVVEVFNAWMDTLGW